ncbi:hypothetical protein TNCV_3006731 [Trichonephila clavipes]|nr:hypothetical protein TNCV_3006731 [Trichonephila clavipes]
MVSHPPYSPDLAPSDFHLFPELKKNLGGTQFQTDEEVQNAVVNFLHGQAAEFYHSVIIVSERLKEYFQQDKEET